MDKERKMLLGDLCNDPYLAIRKGSVQDIQSILSTVRAGVIGGTVSVKDADRSAAAIDEISAKVSEFIKSSNTLRSEREELAAEVAKLFDVNSLESLESSVLREKTAPRRSEKSHKEYARGIRVSTAQDTRSYCTIAEKLAHPDRYIIYVTYLV